MNTSAAAQTDDLTEQAVQALLNTHVLGRTLHIVPTIDSTNTALKQQYMDKPHGFTLVADEQTAGRGSKGRSFRSPKNTGLYFSVLLRPHIPTERLTQFTMVAALAVQQAIVQTSGLAAQIKWVNDVVYQGKKLAGILTEAVFCKEQSTVIVGIGVNLMPSDQWEVEVKRVAGAIGQYVTPPSRAALLAAILNNFEKLLSLTEQKEGQALIAQYRAQLCCIGEVIRVIEGQGAYCALCEGLDEQGALLVRKTDGTLHALNHEEIQIRLDL